MCFYHPAQSNHKQFRKVSSPIYDILRSKLGIFDLSKLDSDFIQEKIWPLKLTDIFLNHYWKAVVVDRIRTLMGSFHINETQEEFVP